MKSLNWREEEVAVLAAKFLFQIINFIKKDIFIFNLIYILLMY